jgi:hypothetical protein
MIKCGALANPRALQPPANSALSGRVKEFGNFAATERVNSNRGRYKIIGKSHRSRRSRLLLQAQLVAAGTWPQPRRLEARSRYKRHPCQDATLRLWMTVPFIEYKLSPIEQSLHHVHSRKASYIKTFLAHHFLGSASIPNELDSRRKHASQSCKKAAENPQDSKLIMLL